MIRLNLTYDENGKINGYILIPLDYETSVEMTEQEFEQLKKDLGEETIEQK